MRHGRSPHLEIRTLSAIAIAAAALGSAPGAAAAATSHASQLAQRVAAATDQQLLITMRQQLGPGYVELTYSDAAKRTSVEFMGSNLYSGDINGSWFERGGKACYSTTRERFVGLTSIGASLLPQGSATTSAIVYKRLGSRELQWSIPATTAHDLEQGTVWFNARDLITRAQDRSYKSGRHGTAQATTITLSYPKTLPTSVPRTVPGPTCKA